MKRYFHFLHCSSRFLHPNLNPNYTCFNWNSTCSNALLIRSVKPPATIKKRKVLLKYGSVYIQIPLFFLNIRTLWVMVSSNYKQKLDLVSCHPYFLLNFLKIGWILLNASQISSFFLAPVKTIFPDAKMSTTILG